MSYGSNALKATALALPLFGLGALPASAAGVVETIQESEQHETFYQALEAAGMLDQLRGGPVTVFAPTDAAFEQLPDSTVDALFEEGNEDALRTLLGYHIVQGQALTSDRLPKEVQTESGTLYIGVLGSGSPVLARTEAYDLEQGAYRTVETDVSQSAATTSPTELQDEAPMAQAEADVATTGTVGQRAAEPTTVTEAVGDQEQELAAETDVVETDITQDPQTTAPTELQDEAPMAQAKADEATTGTMGQQAAEAETLTEIIAGDDQDQELGSQQATAAPGLVQDPETTAPTELQDEAPMAQARKDEAMTGTVGQMAYDANTISEYFGDEPAEGVRIVQADVEADDGVIHSIDYVLVPNRVIEALLR